MAYCGYITTLKNVRPHPNADRMLLADCFGNTVCVGLDSAEGEIGLYLPSDGQVSVEFAKENNLLRLYDENGHSIPGGGYLEPDKRNIKAISLRGVKSDGIFLPIACLAYTGANLDDINVGDTINVVNGHDICQKYIPRGKRNDDGNRAGNRTRKKKAPIAPLFTEHADTEQLAYNLDAFRPGDEIEITLKMHGTSQRTAYVPVFQGYRSAIPWVRWALSYCKENTWLYNQAMKYVNAFYDWGYVSGTRRTVLDNYDGGFYGSNEFREQYHRFFEGKLWKGEEIYYEVVGYTHAGVPIMATGNTPKEYVKEYGKKMEFSYGCRPGHLSGKVLDKEIVNNEGIAYPQSDIYVYRMTMTNEDGDVVEYTPDFMRYRCEQMGVKTVPVLWKGTIPTHCTVTVPVPVPTDNPNECGFKTHTFSGAGEWIKYIAEQYYDGPDPIGKTHIREGVVVRILNRPKFTAYKHKNWCFKVVEGLVKESAEAPDMEEADGLAEEVVDSN